MAANYILLERIELNASASSVTFSNIPQTGYTDLKVVISARTNEANTSTTSYVTFNGSSTGFTNKVLYGTGNIVGTYGNSVNYIGDTNGNTSTANVFGNQEIYISNYTSSNSKSYSVDAVVENNATTATNTLSLNAHLWANTAAITSMTFTNTSTWAANSTFSLYGIAAVGTTPAIAPKATGGNIIATDGTYWYHAFLSNGTFTPQVGLSADVLVVAGGGGGQAGGGGAGGLYYAATQSLSATSYTCTVGAGGANLANGVNSTFGALTAAVGGGGGSSWGTAGQNGGSGAGGGSVNGTVVSGGTGTSGQGNNGGTGVSEKAGGGGGAAAAGSNGASTGGAGGAGSSSYSAWGLATNSGQNVSGTYYFAGGGGGGANGTGGAGGNGGGGAGSNASPTAGATNTGGGGGGAYGAAGQPGGSGIIIVRYTVA